MKGCFAFIQSTGAVLSSVEAGSRASTQAAVAAANRVVLLEFAPSQKAAIEAAYQAALSEMPDGAPRREGIAVGERANSRSPALSYIRGAVGCLRTSLGP